VYDGFVYDEPEYDDGFVYDEPEYFALSYLGELGKT